VQTQAPDEHEVPAGHWTPHPPQLAGSESVFSHCEVAAQYVWPDVGQAHRPYWQTSALGQAFPHAPQLALLELVLTQPPWPGQKVVPDWHPH
jgi:hypothetical protein